MIDSDILIDINVLFKSLMKVELFILNCNGFGFVKVNVERN